MPTEFLAEENFVILEHEDEAAARARYPDYLPMSTTILGSLPSPGVPVDRQPHLILERYGSLAAGIVRRVLAEFGLGLVLEPRAQTD